MGGPSGFVSGCSLKKAIDSGADALAADLRALDKAVAVAARHQQRLGLDAAEIENRKAFVQHQQQQLDALRADLRVSVATEKCISRYFAVPGSFPPFFLLMFMYTYGRSEKT